MTFEQFDKHCDKVISAKLGLGKDDFADACWYDLYEDTNEGEDCTDEDIFETLADADDIAAQMLELVE